MTVRRTVALVALAAAAVMLVLAALTPIRADRIDELDAEATRLGQLWAQDQDNEALAIESNVFFEQARDLEPPVEPMMAIGIALLLSAAGVAAWPRTNVEHAESAAPLEV